MSHVQAGMVAVFDGNRNWANDRIALCCGSVEVVLSCDVRRFDDAMGQTIKLLRMAFIAYDKCGTEKNG